MAYKVIKASGSISGLTKREFIVDTAAEITDLPTNKKMGKKQTGDTVSDEMCAVGSTASVTETGDIYELNASSTWVKKPAEGSGEGSDITIDSTLTQKGQAADAKATGDALATKADASALATKADASALSNYVQTSAAESTYAKKSELSAYATTESLGNYMQTSAADTKYATKTELGSYATTESLEAYMQTTTADGKYATKSELSSYATTDSLADYAKTSELPKGTAVTDATGETDAHTQLNALLASLRAAGLIASS